MQTIREKNTTPAEVPECVRRLDDAINRKLLTTADVNEARRLWALKVKAKQQLAATLTDAEIEEIVARILGEVGQGAEAVA